jgi:hypothetical protein
MISCINNYLDALSNGIYFTQVKKLPTIFSSDLIGNFYGSKKEAKDTKVPK